MGRRRRGQLPGPGYLPPGAANDPKAPYNQPPAPRCPECDAAILDAADHAEGCPWGGKDDVDLREALDSQAKADAVEARREAEAERLASERDHD